MGHDSENHFMCTAVLLRRSGHPWPLLVAANRDEMIDRPWLAPGRHWPDRPDVTAGLDSLAGGTWMGMNDHGLLAGILNRVGTLGPMKGKRSRGELPLEALDHAEARAAVAAMAELDPSAYRPFNMVVADRRDAFWLRHTERAIEVLEVPEGLSMLTAHDLNDPGGSPRQRLYLPRFRRAPAPEPERGDWSAWQRLLASREFEGTSGRDEAMCVVTDTGFCTVSSSLIALPAIERSGVLPHWLFAPGRPLEVDYEPLEPWGSSG